jgi:hypothetical protein
MWKKGISDEGVQRLSKVAQGLDLQTWNVYMTDWDTGERQELLGTVKTNKGPEAKEKAEGKAYTKWGVGGATIGWKIEVEPAD